MAALNFRPPRQAAQGDAADMFRGEGANTALRDAALLTTHLTEVTTGGISLRKAKRRHETEMLRYGLAAAADSTRPYFAEAMCRHPERPTHA